MDKYRVDFYIDDKVIGHAYVSAYSRKEAWIESWATAEYKKARGKSDMLGKNLYFDATKLGAFGTET